MGALIIKSGELQPVSRSSRAPPANATAARGMPGALPHLYYRPLEHRDLDQLHALHKEWFPVRYTDQFYEDLLLPNYSTVLAFSSDTYELVGAATAGCCARKPVTAYIMTLGVASHYRGNGLGSKLLNLIVERTSADCFTLHMLVDNVSALRIYHRFGFKVLETLERHYTINGETYDALLLSYTSPNSIMTTIKEWFSWGVSGPCCT